MCHRCHARCIYKTREPGFPALCALGHRRHEPGRDILPYGTVGPRRFLPFFLVSHHSAVRLGHGPLSEFLVMFAL